MGAYSSTINNTVLTDLIDSNGKYLLSYSDSHTYDKRAYPTPGLDGSLVTKMGKLGMIFDISFLIRANGMAAWHAAYKAAGDDWKDDNAPFSITDPAGASRARCYMVPESMRITRMPLATGCSDDQIWGTISVRFRSYDADA